MRPQAKHLQRRENAVFRDIARRFASFRDADVRLEAFDKLVGEENGSKRFAPLRDLLVEGEASKPLEEQVALAAKQADAARGRLQEADISNDATFKLIRPGLRCIYRRGRKAMSKAYKESEEASFHEWRKRVKISVTKCRSCATVGRPFSRGCGVNSISSETCSAKTTI